VSTTTDKTADHATAPHNSTPSRTMRNPLTWWNDPWRPPRVLTAITTGYLVWALLPVLIAVVFSFNSTKSRTNWEGFSIRWYWGDQTYSVWHDAALHAALVQTFKLGLITTLVTVPLGVLFAIGIDRWRGRLPSSANVLMLVSFVVPEVLLAVALLFVVTSLAVPIQLGTAAQVVGLVTFQIAYPAVLVRARLATIGKHYEEAAMDLGATAVGALRRVTLPMLMPAIFASTVLVFADVIDDFVIVRYLSSGAPTEPVSVKIYNTARGMPTPALNALATLLLLASLAAIVIGFLLYRRFSRGADKSEGGIAGFAGELA
jgi:spermidine/putrescine transport system permease protein